MEEKVINEVRFIETEDGFRIEVKGDKERMREMGFGPGMNMGFVPGMGMGFGPRFGRRFWGYPGRYGSGGGWGWGRGYAPPFGPWGWWWDAEPVPEDEPPAE